VQGNSFAIKVYKIQYIKLASERIIHGRWRNGACVEVATRASYFGQRTIFGV